MFDLVIRRGAVCLGEETPVTCDLGIRDGVIAAISLGDLDGRDVVDAEGKIVLPGTVDPHVHIRAPGHDERETFFSGTCDAAAGGVTGAGAGSGFGVAMTSVVGATIAVGVAVVFLAGMQVSSNGIKSINSINCLVALSRVSR